MNHLRHQSDSEKSFRTDIRFFWWITSKIMSRENMQWDINAYLTEKNSLPDTSRRNR